MSVVFLPVMHESSKKVAETLKEIYSAEWDGFEDLKAIAQVSVPHLCYPVNLIVLSYLSGI